MDENTSLLRRCQVQRFCLTLVWEARYWYESLEPINVDWQGLQNLFRQQYSKMGNTRELFHAWRSFYFDENTETKDSYVTGVRQVATLLGYGEPEILEVFRNTLPTKSILGTISHRWFKASGRNSKKNTNKRRDTN